MTVGLVVVERVGFFGVAVCCGFLELVVVERVAGCSFLELVVVERVGFFGVAVCCGFLELVDKM